MEKGEIIGRGARAVVYALPEGKALKLYPPTTDPEIIKSVEYEAWLGRAVYDAGLAVPRVYGTVNEAGAPGIVYERIEGQEMLHALFSHPDRVGAFASEMADMHAEMHDQTIPGLPRAMAILKGSMADRETPPEFADLGDISGAALRALNTLADGDRLCHGDFHPKNIMISPRGTVTIDWTGACLCAPVADVARTVLLLKMIPAFIPAKIVERAKAEAVMAELLRAYLQRYQELRLLNPTELAAWELPLAVARIGENLPQEWSRLKPLIAGHMAGQTV